MITLSRRVELLLEAHRMLRHTEYRTVKELSIWDQGADPLEPIVVRKARAFRLLLEETPAVIMDHELIVGLRTLYGALDEGENVFGGAYMLPVKPATMHNKRFYPRYLTDEEAAAARGMGVAEGGFTSHVPFGTEKVLSRGLRGVKEQAAAGLAELEEDGGKAAFLNAVLVSLDAVTEHIRRHTDEALRLRDETRDEARREELKEIADGCLWVSTEPPRTFREALQLYWFCCLAMAAESQSCIPIGRFDQDLYPYLERDLDAGETTLGELRLTLRDDWGDERLRQYALNRVPKWGNDDDYVDAIAVTVAGHFIDEALRHRNPRGGPYYPGIFTFHHVSRGVRSSASPDGRRAGDPVSTHLSPVAGTDKAGPTLTVNSALKVYALLPPEGTALDLRFHPTALMGEEGVEKLESFIKAFMSGGGTVVQFNVVDSETLRDAQANPERYRSLLVRVWGFSAYFTTLTKEYQDEIIARTMHGLD